MATPHSTHSQNSNSKSCCYCWLRAWGQTEIFEVGWGAYHKHQTKAAPKPELLVACLGAWFKCLPVQPVGVVCVCVCGGGCVCVCVGRVGMEQCGETACVNENCCCCCVEENTKGQSKHTHTPPNTPRSWTRRKNCRGNCQQRPPFQKRRSRRRRQKKTKNKEDEACTPRGFVRCLNHTRLKLFFFFCG